MRISSKRPGTKTAGDVVTQEAAARRLQRRYHREGLALRKTRPVDVPTLGEWHVVDCGLNAVVRKNIDIGQEAIKAGVVRSYETIAG